jgi:hypothetical protein
LVVQSPTTYDPPDHVPPLSPLSPEEQQAVITASGWPGVDDGLPAGEHSGERAAHYSRGLYPDPGIYSKMERRNPVIASGLAKMEHSVASLDWRILPPTDEVSQLEYLQTEFTKTCMNSIESGFSGLVSRMFSTQTQYGFCVFEKVWQIDEMTGLWRLEDLLWVPPWSISK